jgi:hypothetical protein
MEFLLSYYYSLTPIQPGSLQRPCGASLIYMLLVKKTFTPKPPHLRRNSNISDIFVEAFSGK